MNIVLYLFLYVIVLGCFFITRKNTPRIRLIYIVLVLTALTLESSLRGLSVGSDTLNYYYYFENVKYTSWEEILHHFYLRYVFNDGTFDEGYSVYQKLFQLLSGDFHLFLFTSALFFFVPFGLLLYRYTKTNWELLFIFVFYVSLFNMIAMSGVRKEIALGLSILSLLFYYDKAYLKAAIALAIGTTIHMSILLIVLVPLVGLLPLKIQRTLHLAIFFMIPYVISNTADLIVNMADVLDNEKYRQYGESEAQGGAWTFVILMELLSLFCLIAFWNVKLKKEIVTRYFYPMLPLLTFFAPFILQSGSMIRISQYFHLYILLLLPVAIELSINKKEIKPLYAFLIVVLILLAMKSSTLDYVFFWQEKVYVY